MPTQSNPIVLIIDDSLVSLRLAEKSLKTYAYDVVTCQSGADGFEIAKKVKPDIILLDVMMPEVNGYEVCRRIRSDSEISKVPVIFITTLNRAVDIKDCIQSGGSGYLSKPYTSEKLFESIETHLNISRLNSEKQEPRERQLESEISENIKSNNFNILVIDDSEVMRKIITKRIREMEIKVGDIYTAENGQDALEVLSRQPIDICFCDWNMPKMNGISFVKKVREESRYDNISIIMVTTEASEERVKEAENAGANGYVSKPFTPTELQRRVHEVIEIKK